MKKAIAIIALLILAVAGYKLWPHSSTTLPKILFGTTGGPNNPSSFSQTSFVGYASWSNLSNLSACDAAYATASLSGTASPSDIISSTGYGFSIPTNATINGVTLAITHKSSLINNLNDATVELIKGGSAVGINKASATFWATTAETFTYGGTSDLWGTTLTPSDVNASNFGVSFNVDIHTSSGTTASVDCQPITVTYTVANQHVTVTHTAGTLTITQGTVVIP